MAHRYLSTAEQSLVLNKLAAYVADYLTPEGFTYTPPSEDSYSHKLVGPNEATLYLRMTGDTKGDRVEISGGFHIGKSKYGNLEFVRPNCGVPNDISVALSRGPDAIAKEIKNRYLPKYLSALTQARDQRDKAEAYTQAKLANLQRLQNLGGDARKIARDAEGGYLSIGEVYGHIEATDDSARLDLRCLTIKQAEAVINLLKGSNHDQE